MGDFVSFLGNNLVDFWGYTGFANATPGHLFMLLIGLFFIGSKKTLLTKPLSSCCRRGLTPWAVPKDVWRSS